MENLKLYKNYIIINIYLYLSVYLYLDLVEIIKIYK